MPRNTPLSGQFPPDKESASEGPEARRGVRPEVPPSPAALAREEALKAVELESVEEELVMVE